MFSSPPLLIIALVPIYISVKSKKYRFSYAKHVNVLFINISWIFKSKGCGFQPDTQHLWFGKMLITTSLGQPKPCEGIWKVW